MKRIQYIFSVVVVAMLTVPAQAGMSSIVLAEYGVKRITGLLCSCVITVIAMSAMVREGYAIAHPREELTERWSMGKRIDAHGRPIEKEPNTKMDEEPMP